MTTPPPQVIIYTDGACRGNPGAGGYGTLLISNNRKKELSEGYRLTTNNRMELMAVIAGLEALKIPGCEVIIYSDSKYVVEAVEKKWLFAWLKTGFKGKKNADLWMRFLELYNRHKVRFVWVKGHASNEGNERCDQLAVEASQQPVLQEDSGYQPD